MILIDYARHKVLLANCKCNEEIFRLLDLPFTSHRQLQRIEVEGYGLSNLLKGEVGIHLFRGINDALLPIKVFLTAKQVPIQSPSLHQVIRIYKTGNILYDLRTEISNVMPIAAQEMKLLLYAGVIAN